MVSHLYVIGNGFDKHHHIPSGYQDYRVWLERNKHLDVLETIDELFGLTDDDWWCHFEENLSSVEALRIAVEEAFEHFPNFGSDDFRDRDWYEAELSVETKMERAYDTILESFSDWVMQLPDGNINNKIKLERDSLFLTFNYSHTLENLYAIPSGRILHIHGKAGVGEELILGHGLTYNELEKKMGERVEEGDYVLQRAKDAAIYTVLRYKKNVEYIIEKNNKWFSSLSTIKNIHIYGHSLGRVDWPYFHKVFDSVDKKNLYVEISDHKNENYKKIHRFMKKEGFRRNQYGIVELDYLCPKE